MSGGSVRDRIKAAEALQGGGSGENSDSPRRRGHRLSLKTDEHIKEEFLRRGDGGWHKKVDIGQQEKFLPRPDLPPVIKLTAETPVVPEPKRQLPGKLPKRGSVRFEDMSVLVDGQPSVAAGQDYKQMEPTVTELPPVVVVEPTTTSTEPSEKKEEDWDRVARLEAEQQAAMDAEAAQERVARMEAEQQAAMEAEAAAEKAKKKATAKEKPQPKEEAPKIIPGSFDSVPEPAANTASKDKDDDWDRVRRLEAEQQAHMDAEAALSEAAIEEAAKEAHEDWDRVRRMEAAQQARMDAEAALEEELAAEEAERKHNEKHEEPARSHKQEVPVGRFEDLLVDARSRKPSTSKPQERERNRTFSQSTESHAQVKHKTVRVAPAKEAAHPKAAKEDLSHRESILFDPLEWERKKKAKEERHAARKYSATERLSVDVGHKEKARPRSPSIRLLRVDHSDEDDHVHRERREPREQHRRRSHSRSDHKHESGRTTPPDSARRSSSSLWPSFSNSERRSMGDILESPSRSHSRHRRSTSDAHSTITTKTDISSKNLEFMEYVAGKKLDHLPHSPPKSPTRPMGFVRSHSHTGEYSEGYTRDKKLLKKPSDNEIVEHADHDWERKPHHESRHHSHSHKKDDPWQLKLLNQIARG